MPEPDRGCGRVSFLPSARVRMTRPPGIGRPSGAVRVGPSKYSAVSDLPCAQLYWTVATGEGAWASAAPAVRHTNAATSLASMKGLLAATLPARRRFVHGVSIAARRCYHEE